MRLNAPRPVGMPALNGWLSRERIPQTKDTDFGTPPQLASGVTEQKDDHGHTNQEHHHRPQDLQGFSPALWPRRAKDQALADPLPDQARAPNQTLRLRFGISVSMPGTDAAEKESL